MKYTPFELEQMMESMTILVDTREQITARFRKRVKEFHCPFTRRKLDYGDYSASYIDLNGQEQTLERRVVIERKMGADEICQGMTWGRKRFIAEFERAKADGAKIYLLIENVSWETLLDGEYRSRLDPKSLKASLLAWCARYYTQIFFCQEKTTGGMIRDIMHYELKEMLRNEQ